MKKTNVFLSVGLLFCTSAFAGTHCFLVKEKDQVIIKEGDCKSRHSPCATFKIAISLIGFNEGLLVDENHPELPFKTGYVDFIEKWKEAQSPSSWMKYGCVWYSQLLTQQLGMEKFSDYAAALGYGNQDLSGDVGRNNGLTNSWLSSSLEISPEEQIHFLHH